MSGMVVLVGATHGGKEYRCLAEGFGALLMEVYYELGGVCDMRSSCCELVE